MVIISDISVKWRRRSNLSGGGANLASACFGYINMTSPHIGCLILPGLHSGWWYSAISEISMLCSEAHFSNIHACTINMNWWRRNCKACNPTQNSISNRYLILPSVTKSRKLLDGREMSYFAQFFSCCPPGLQIQFSTKSCSEDNKINRGLYPEVDQ